MQHEGVLVDLDAEPLTRKIDKQLRQLYLEPVYHLMGKDPYKKYHAPPSASELAHAAEDGLRNMAHVHRPADLVHTASGLKHGAGAVMGAVRDRVISHTMGDGRLHGEQGHEAVPVSVGSVELGEVSEAGAASVGASPALGPAHHADAHRSGSLGIDGDPNAGDFKFL